MTGRLYIDIETANVSGPLREVARPFMKIDSRLKDEEKIAAAYDKALDATALNGLWGEVITVGLACDDGKPWCLMHQLHPPPERQTEKQLLSSLGDDINYLCNTKWHKGTPQVIGHNVQFDIRFLYQRFIVHDLTVPYWLPINAKPWDTDKVFDTLVQWYGPKLDPKVKPPSLTALCTGLGIEVPETIDGAEVPKAWLEGRYDEIRAHVLADVEAVRQVHYRMCPTYAASR